MLAFYLVRVHQMAFTTECGGEKLIAAHYSFIDPEKMKG